MSHPFVLSFGYRQASSELRSQLAEQQTAVESALVALDLDSWLLLSTCNRFEVWGYTERNDLPQSLLATMGSVAAVSTSRLAASSFFAAGRPAIQHTFTVAAGLDSLLLGEGQILGQLRATFDRAREGGHCRGPLTTLVQTALRVGKRVRSETGIAHGKVSLAGCALELAQRQLGTLRDRTVLIVGSGKMSRVTARSLDGVEVGRIIVANRTLKGAEEVAALCGGTPIRLSALPAALIDADVVLSATAASRPIVRAHDVQAAARQRPVQRVVIDLAIPYDIESAVRVVPGVRLFRGDDLAQTVAEHLAEREASRRPALDIVLSEVERYLHAQRMRTAAPTICALLERAEVIRRREVERARVAVRGTAEEEAMERLSRSLVKTLLHEPIVQTRLLSEHQPDMLQLVRTLFALDQSSLGSLP